MAEALQTDCAKCNAKQKEIIKKMARHMFMKEKTVYAEVEAKYDPEGKYRKVHEKEFSVN